MPVEQINGLGIAYEVIGQGQPWVITPGGRFSKDAPGVRELAQALAATGKQVLIWDRPNTGASEVCFDGDSESVMQADVLAGLLRALGMAPAVISGGSGGSRVSLLAAARHPDVARALAVWWISGGPYGLLTLGTHYCGDSIAAAWRYGMDAVAALPEWAEVLERNPVNRAKFLTQDPRTFIETLEQWMLAYCPRPDELVPGLPDADRAGDGRFRPWCFAAGPVTPITPGRPRNAWPTCSPARNWSSRRGVTGNGPNGPRRPPHRASASSRAGPCWRRQLTEWAAGL